MAKPQGTGRATRATRSQSREPEVDNAPSTAPNRRGGRRGAKGADNDLPAVTEESADDQQLRSQLLASAATAQIDDEALRRTSAHTDISGTTAKTSFSKEEIADMDRDVMIDALPRLASDADELIKFLLPNGDKVPSDLWKAVRTANTREQKLFERRLTAFNMHKDSYGSQDYIQPDFVLRALLRVDSMNDVPAAPWRPDNVLCKANLAIMLRVLLVTCDPSQLSSEESFRALEQLEIHFPTAIAGPAFDLDAFQMCLEIQTQLAMARLSVSAPDPRFDAFSLIESAFFDDDRDYKYFDALHLGSTDIDVGTLFNERIIQLGEPFKNDSFSSPHAAIAALRTEYQWDAFIKKVISFYGHRKTNLEKHIKAAGGVAKIKAGLDEAMRNRDLAREADVMAQSLLEGDKPEKSFNVSTMAKLKNRRSRASGVQPAPVASMTVQSESITGANDEWPQVDEEAGFSSIQQTATSTLQQMGAMADFRNELSRRGKQRSFVDAQPNAERVIFNDSLESQQSAGVYEPETSAIGPYHVNPQGGANKRSRDQMEDSTSDFDPTQDEGFQTDMRDTSAADERRRKAPRSLAPNSRPSTQPARMEMDEVNFQIPGYTQRKNPGASMPELPTGSVSGSAADRQWSYAQAKVQARAKSVMATQNRPPQVRTPWSQDEENALISLIEEFGADGIKYSVLKGHDNARGDDAQLRLRDAEQLRFKARNMKVTMLLAGAGLPPNWEFVVIDKKARDKLESRGIPYHQDPIRISNKSA